MFSLISHLPPLIRLIRSSWFNQTDVDALVAAGINTVRIPVSLVLCQLGYLKFIIAPQLGYWIIEALVDRTTEFYPRGGLDQLVRNFHFSAYPVLAYNSLYSAPRIEATPKGWHRRYSRPPCSTRFLVPFLLAWSFLDQFPRCCCGESAVLWKVRNPVFSKIQHP